MAKTRQSFPRKDLTGMKFGHLTPIEWIRGGYWKCQCDCGNETIVDTRNLTTGIHRAAAVQEKQQKTFLL